MTTLAKAIIETPSLDALRLRALAYESLKACERDPRKAIVGFLAAVRSDRNLLFELIGYAAARDRALDYLDEAATDMAGEGAQTGTERHGVVRPSSAAPLADNETEGEDAQRRGERLQEHRSSPSAPVSDEGDAPSVCERPRTPRSPASEAPSLDGDAQVKIERLPTSRSPSSAPIPLPKRGAAELKTIKEVAPRSAFDSIRLRDNRSIGDLQWSAIDRFIRDNTYEAALLRQVKAYNPPADPNALIRDVIPLGEFERMAQKAAENLQ